MSIFITIIILFRDNKATVVKDFKLYKRPEEKYQIYNPLSGKRQMDYIPKYNMMVQSMCFQKIKENLKIYSLSLYL